MKPVKIKRNRSIYSRRGKRLKSILRVFAVVLVCACLVGIGFLIAEPVMNFISGKYNVPPEPPSSQTDPGSQPEGSEKPEEPEAPAELKGIALPAETAADQEQLAAFLQTAKTQGYTAVYVAGKADNGQILLSLDNETYAPYEAPGAPSAKAVAKAISDAGLTPVVGLTMFSDATLAYGRRDFAIGYMGPDMLWLDNAADAGGKPWINPYNSEARTFLTNEISAFRKAGFTEVVLSGVRFPPYGGEGSAAYYGTVSTSREDLISSFLKSVKSSLGEGESAAVEVTYTAAVGEKSEMYPIAYGKNDLGRTYVTISAQELGISAAVSAEDASTALKEAMSQLKAVSSGTLIPVFTADMPHLDILLKELEAEGFKEYLVR